MNKDLPVWLWGLIAGVGTLFIGFIDWMTGYEFNFVVFYFMPVSLGAWFIGLDASLVLAVFSAVVWFGADTMSGHIHLSYFHAVWNTMVRLISFLVIGWSIFKIRQLLDRERKEAEDLRRSLAEIKVLEAYLSICSQCKKIRNEEGKWQPLETYIGEHSDTTFSHGYCPECAKKALAEAGLTGKNGKT